MSLLHFTCEYMVLVNIAVKFLFFIVEMDKLAFLQILINDCPCTGLKYKYCVSDQGSNYSPFSLL